MYDSIKQQFNRDKGALITIGMERHRLRDEEYESKMANDP